METSDLIFIVGVPILLGLAAVVTSIAAWLRRGKLVAELGDSEGFLRAMHDEQNNAPLINATREHVVRSARADERYVLSKSLAAVRREYVEDEVSHHWAFWVGGLLTGLALLVTFILIAYVMTNDISGAIRDTSTSGTATDRLSDAVRTLGGKFYISAAGIGGSVVAMFFTNAARTRIYRAAERPSAALLAAFTTVEAQQLDAKLEELEQARAEREERARHHAELCGRVEALGRGLDKLGSIEVSVKTIGNEVSANLKNIMKDAMGEQLTTILSDTMVEVNRIAERIEAGISRSFRDDMTRLSATLQRSIDALTKVVEGQGQGQLEKILDKLQNTVSGGFQSESQKMVAALDQFAKVVPMLEQQLRSITDQVAAETKQRSEEGARMTRLLLERVSGLVNSLDAQQQANAETIARIQAASTQGAEEMARRLEASGANVVSSVLATSRGEIEAIVSQLRAQAEANAHQYGNLENRAAHASASISQASQALEDSARLLVEFSNHTNVVLSHIRQNSEGMQVASHGFQVAGQELASTVQRMQQVVERTSTQTQQQEQLLAKQQQYTAEVEKLWPQLFEVYLRKFKESSDQLQSSWSTFHANVESMAKSVGSEFAESTHELSDAVSKLVELNGKRRATP